MKDFLLYLYVECGAPPKHPPYPLSKEWGAQQKNVLPLVGVPFIPLSTYTGRVTFHSRKLVIYFPKTSHLTPKGGVHTELSNGMVPLSRG